MGLFSRFFGPPSQDQFAKILLNALRKAGDKRPCQYDPKEFRLIHTEEGEQAGITNLRNLYIEYCNLPKSVRNSMLDRVCRGLLNPMETPEEFEDVKPDLLPTVRSRALIEVFKLEQELAGSDKFELPMLPLTDHLIICLVYDLPTTIRFVNQDNLNHWGVTFEEAFQIALENLKNLPAVMMELNEKLYVLETGDAYDGTRILNKARIRELKFQGDPMALPLSRDCLLLTGSEDTEGLRMMLDIARTKQNEARPLCPIPIRLIADRWETWHLPVEHPHRGEFKKLELGYLASEYAEQKTLLDKQHEKLGLDIFVASLTVLERQGEFLSYCVWTKDVPSWLPQADYVSLYDSEKEKLRFVRWERLQAVARDSIELLDVYPPRFSVKQFPSEDMIEVMQPEDWSA